MWKLKWHIYGHISWFYCWRARHLIYHCEGMNSSVYGKKLQRLTDKMFYWMDKRKDALVNSLHWLIVDDEYQGKGYGRLLCTAIMNPD